jgi:hypothetical protein
MKEFVFMEPSKETDHQLRWRADAEDHAFDLYIPKWRVPQPWPRRILVHIREVEPSLKTSPANRSDPSSLERGITAIVRRVSDKSGTVQFSPEGDKDYWEIGSPYIPYSLLPTSSAAAVQVQVWWDHSAGTWHSQESLVVSKGS